MRRIVNHDRTDSTNERALEEVESGAAKDGDVHVARVQESGRGRRGRPWESREDEGLYFSYVHRPRVPATPGAPPLPTAPAITIAAGLATLDVVQGLGLRAARLDWPNDVVVGDGPQAPKLAGVLVESRALDPESPHFVVGVGLNVRQRDFSPELLAERGVTSLALEGIESTPESLVEPLAAALDGRLREARESPGTLARAYLAATDLEGRRVSVRTAKGERVGRLVGIDLERGLTLEESGGTAHLGLAHVHGVERLSI